MDVMQAWVDRVPIQLMGPCGKWIDWSPETEPTWNFEKDTWRIKPKDPIDEAYDRLTANQQFNRVEIDYLSFRLGWEAREEEK